MSEDSDVSAFAERMKYCAGKVGNAARLARETGISRRAIGDYLAGEVEPSRPRLVAIANAAGVCVEWLATGKGPRVPSETQIQHADFDRELFTDCWLAVEELLDGLGKELTGRDLIELVFAVYELQLLERAEGRQGLNMANVIRLVRTAA
ncbi:MAG: XRE family transcriptional regulator [Rhodospirillaceae bacterium]|nr:MAG: XRE family transcriptional regulator [Rhodospirillaceae bacterium]